MPVEYDLHPLPPEGPLTTLDDPSFDFLARVQEVINSPSPLMRIFEDPPLLGQSKSKSKRPGRSSRSPHREHRSPYVVALALAEEERQANTLKSLLRSTSDHLDYERRRAEEATSRASDVDLRAQRATFRASAAESAQKQLEEQVASLKEELRRIQLHNKSLEREARRARDEVRRLEQEIEDLQDSEHRSGETVRKLQATLREYEAREGDQEENRRQAMERSFEEGRDEGWDVGYKSGYRRGKRAGYASGVIFGRKEGIREGWEQGRNEERRNALEAFDRFLAEGQKRDSVDKKSFGGIRVHYPADDESISSLGDSASRR